MRIILLCIFLSGCSLTWHNRDWPVHSRVGQCPVDEWPIGVDGLGFLATGIAASSVYMYSSKIDFPAERIYAPLTMIAVAFLVSTIGGLGEIVGCNRKEL